MTSSIKVLRIKDVQNMIGIARSTIYDWMDVNSPRYDPSFPKPLKLGKSSIGWFESKLIEWLEFKQH
jgi:prophage regulatory protein